MDYRLVICNNQRLTNQKKSCGLANAIHIKQLKKLMLQQQIPIIIEYRKCLGQCEKGPNIRLAPSGKNFHYVSDADISAIIDEIKWFIDS
ncbi:MAG: (2Fe-2S) ferredoxin domain-containing protein [Chromatiales bacterium]|nr:(2Fe-2S) ferredoxin domain-containing protein [Chromatiales bacterium]